MRHSFCLIALLLAACGETIAASPDGGPPPPDARPTDDGGPPPDAAVPDDPRPSRAVLSAAGTVRGGALTLDVQIGEAFAPASLGGGDLSLTPHQPITP